jgi:hypothetical protein
VATGGVVASLLVALYYRQTAILAEQTELQRRQTELLERLHDRDGAGTDGGQPQSRLQPDAPDSADSPARSADQDGTVDVPPSRVADAPGPAGSTARADGAADAAPREGSDPEPSVADRDDPARDEGPPSQRR